MIKKSIVLISVLFLGFVSHSLFAQTIKVQTLSSAPTLDGVDREWKGPYIAIPLTKTKPDAKSDVQSVSLQVGVFGDEVYVIAQWKDSTEDNTLHKPYVWDASKSKYGKGTQKEDRFAMQFAVEGDYTTDWFSGNTFTADMWHWKASRSNPLGLAHDKMTLIGTKKSKKAYRVTAKNGKTIYIHRPSDQGDKLYFTKRYSKKEKDVMPKYILNKNVQGSITDIKANGVWKNGTWTLEMKRKLNTGNSDDVVLKKGKSIKAGIAIFNHSGNDDHNFSRVLTLQF